MIERFKSGFQPPEDIPFEDLSAIKNGEAPPPQTNGYSNSVKLENQSLTYKGTMSGGKSKKRTGLFGIFGNNKVSIFKVSSTGELNLCFLVCRGSKVFFIFYFSLVELMAEMTTANFLQINEERNCNIKSTNTQPKSSKKRLQSVFQITFLFKLI